MTGVVCGDDSRDALGIVVMVVTTGKVETEGIVTLRFSSVVAGLTCCGCMRAVAPDDVSCVEAAVRLLSIHKR